MDETSDVGKITVLKVKDPRLDIKADREYIAMMGASMISTKAYVADSFDASSAVWAITTPSVRVGLDRRVEVEAQFLITCKRDDNPALYAVVSQLQRLNAGLRQFPLHSVIRNAEGQLNNQAFSCEFSRIIHGLLRYGNTVEDRQYFMGATAHYPDNYCSYDIAAPNAGARWPFISYFNCSIEDSRSLDVWGVAVNKDTLAPAALGVANGVLVTLRESLMMSPFHWGQGDVQALFGIQQFDLTLSFENLNRMLAGTEGGWAGQNTGIFGANDATHGRFSTLLVEPVDRSAKLHITYLTPPPDWKIPRILHYPYYTINKLVIKSGAVFNPTAEASRQMEITTNAINRNDISKRLYLIATPLIDYSSNTLNAVTHAGGSITTPNFFGIIKKVVMSFDNQDGRLANLDQFDFWKINAKNSLNSSWPEASKYLGSPLCLEFGTDLNLNPLLSSGVRGTFNYQATVTVADPRQYMNPQPNEDLFFELYSVFIPEGVFTIDDQLCSFDIATLTEQTLANAPFAPLGFRVHVRNYQGAGFFSNLWSALKKGFKKVAPVVRKVAEVVGNVAPMIPHPYAQAVGVGANVANKALQMAGGRRKGRSRSRKRGGALIRTSSLADRL